RNLVTTQTLPGRLNVCLPSITIGSQKHYYYLFHRSYFEACPEDGIGPKTQNATCFHKWHFDVCGERGIGLVDSLDTYKI
ncbi:MAG: hypothetical protein ABIV51_01620, partial [Saprospiraceae bacterium]